MVNFKGVGIYCNGTGEASLMSVACSILDLPGSYSRCAQFRKFIKLYTYHMWIFLYVHIYVCICTDAQRTLNNSLNTHTSKKDTVLRETIQY